jgi:hypothetical protein
MSKSPKSEFQTTDATKPRPGTALSLRDGETTCSQQRRPAGHFEDITFLLPFFMYVLFLGVFNEFMLCWREI